MAVVGEEEVALGLRDGVARVPGGGTGAGQRDGLAFVEAGDGVEVFLDLAGPGAGARVLEQVQGQGLEGLARGAVEHAAPRRRGAREQAPESHDPRVRRGAEAATAVAGHRVAREAQEAHQREERLDRHLPRPEGAVQLEGREGRG
jgi:hypothetical protein